MWCCPGRRTGAWSAGADPRSPRAWRNGSRRYSRRPNSPAALAATVRAAVAEGDEVLIAHEEAEDSITGQQLGACAARVWILIGPEGGISPQEVDQLHQAGARPVSLGPYVLRASTAGPIA